MKTWLTVFILSVLVLSGCDKYEKAFTEEQVIDMAYQFVQEECLFPKEPNPLVQKPFQKERNSIQGLGPWKPTYVENWAFIPIGVYSATHLEEWTTFPNGTEGKAWLVEVFWERYSDYFGGADYNPYYASSGISHKSFNIAVYDDLGEKKHGKVQWANFWFMGGQELNAEPAFLELLCKKVEGVQLTSPMLEVTKTNLDPTGLLLRDLANLVRDYRNITGKYVLDIENIPNDWSKEDFEGLSQEALMFVFTTDMGTFIHKFIVNEIKNLKLNIQESPHYEYQNELMSSVTYLEEGISKDFDIARQMRQHSKKFYPRQKFYDPLHPDWVKRLGWNPDEHLDEFYAEFNEIIKMYNSQK